MKEKTVFILAGMIAIPFAGSLAFAICLSVMWAGYLIGLPIDPSLRNAALFTIGFFIVSPMLGKLSELMLSFSRKDGAT